MNIFKTFKNALLIYWDGAKHYPVDMAICLMAIGALIYWWLNPGHEMAGGVAILLVYSSGNVIRHNRSRKVIKDLIDKIKDK